MTNPSTDLPSLKIRKSKKSYLLAAGIFIVIIVFNLFNRREEIASLFYPDISILGIVLIVIVLGLLVYLIINLLDNKLRMIISEEGIWTKKYNTIPWADIWYFHTTEHKEKMGVKFETLVLKLKDIESQEGRKLKIRLSMLDISINTLHKALDVYCEKYGIQNLGHDKV